MSGHMVLLHLLGGVALLLWATRMVRTGIMRAFGEDLRRGLSQAISGRLRAALAGLLVSTALQSSTATAVLLVSFLSRNLLGLAAALAVMLGADLGSTLVVQALSFDLSQIVPVALIAGVALFMLGKSSRLRQVGRVLIGLGLIVLSLGLIVDASEPLRTSDVVALVLQRLAGDPILGVLIAAMLTWLLHSSVAFILLVVSLAGAGVVSPLAGMALVLGANIGSGMIPLGLSIGASVAAKRVLYGNLAFRVAGAIAILFVMEPAANLVAALESEPARQIANFHTLFNLALVVVFLPLTGLVARALNRIAPEPPAAPGETRLTHLDEALLDRPALAISAATREVLRLADTVEIMFREAILTFNEREGRRREEISRLDDEVDALQEEIKLYLARLTRQRLTAEESRQVIELILFTTNLEHVGDIIDKSLLRLAAKRQRLDVAFSAEGWRDIQAFHHRVSEQLRLSVAVFVTGDLDMARALIVGKEKIRDLEQRATERHLERLREGAVASIETSSLHLDVLRDLKRINSHLSAIAYPLLEAQGEIRTSRLIEPEPE